MALIKVACELLPLLVENLQKFRHRRSRTCVSPKLGLGAKWAGPAHGLYLGRAGFLSWPVEAQAQGPLGKSYHAGSRDREYTYYPPGRKRTHTLVERTSGKPPTPARAAPELPQSPTPVLPSSSSPPPPPSTAPAMVYTGRGGRESKRTTKGAEAKAEGWLPGSQPRE